MEKHDITVENKT